MDNELTESIGRLLFPGDRVTSINSLEASEETSKIKLGPGLRQLKEDVVATKAGFLKYKETPSCLWVDTNQKRYVAVKNDSVIGIISGRGIDAYKVDIGTSQNANLDRLAFEGATKKHKPDLNANDIVFGKISLALKDMEPELTCLEAGQKANGLGPLTGGYMFTVSLGLCRRLLEMPQCKVLVSLGKHFPFEIIVGMNGRVWVSSKGIIDTIAIANAIASSEFMGDEQVEAMVKQLVSSIAGFNDGDDDDDEDDDIDNAREDVQMEEEGNLEY